MRSPAILILSSFLAIPALASDGIQEINQTCAVQTGCFGGDTAGFPVTIRSAGSYRLTSNLLLRGTAVTNTDGISIEGDHVTVDMAGFEIRCEVPNIPAPFPCSSVAGTGDGIVLSFAENVRIANGTIRNFSRHGVHATQTGTDYQLHAMRIFGNGENGVESRSNGSIMESMVMDNGGIGIHVDAFGALILGTVTYGNAAGGITDGNGQVAAGTSAFRDGGTGISSADLVACITLGASVICP